MFTLIRSPGSVSLGIKRLIPPVSCLFFHFHSSHHQTTLLVYWQIHEDSLMKLCTLLFFNFNKKYSMHTYLYTVICILSVHILLAVAHQNDIANAPRDRVSRAIPNYIAVHKIYNLTAELHPHKKVKLSRRLGHPAKSAPTTNFSSMVTSCLMCF